MINKAIINITKQSILVFVLFCLSAITTFNEIRAQDPYRYRTDQPTAWFDSVYQQCVSAYKQLSAESTLTATEEVYDKFVQPIQLSIYNSLGMDLDKRQLYWEVEDRIWHIDPQQPFNRQLANNYVSATGDSFLLKDFMRKLMSMPSDMDKIMMIRKAYQLEHYQEQLEYIDVNYKEENVTWVEYKEDFKRLMNEIADLADSFNGEEDNFTQRFMSVVQPLDELFEVMPIRLPSTPLEPGKFGAFYTHLPYYPDWDKHWRVEQHPDVVVRFEDNLHKFVFWRGTNYIPHWVTEKGFWYNNEFTETWASYGASEPMSDKQCRYSHVRVLHSHPARVVVHWRYALADVDYHIAWPDAFTKWGDWCDEYYTIYPDASGVRNVILHTTHQKDYLPLTIEDGDEDGHEWQEGILVYHPYTRPEDYLHLDAVHVANMDGQSGKWSWEKPGEPTTPTPEGTNIVMMNMKSDLKPYIISPEGCELYAYGGAQGGSHFRWRDHWPTTTFPTPGRDANGKQAAHGSFYHLVKIPYTIEEHNKLAKVMLHGLTDGNVEGLVPAAHAWLQPPTLEVLSENLADLGYDRSEKAYKFRDDGDPESAFSFHLHASDERPVIHPVLIIEQCNLESPRVSMNGKSLKNGVDYSVGLENELNSSQLVIWLNKEISSPTIIKIKKN